jgi:hypothetical protein
MNNCKMSQPDIILIRIWFATIGRPKNENYLFFQRYCGQKNPRVYRQWAES